MIHRRKVLAASWALPAVVTGVAAFADDRPPPPVSLGTTITPGQPRSGSGIPLKPGERLPDEYRELDPVTGQQKGYAVLTAEERGKGFVRPVRTVYTHLVCGTDTSMSLDIAETFARDPKFYNGTFCLRCRKHFPLAQFVWQGTQETVGS